MDDRQEDETQEDGTQEDEIQEDGTQEDEIQEDGTQEDGTQENQELLKAGGLSPRMIMALKGVARGKTREQVAHELGISISTLRSYMEGAYSRLGVHKAPEAIARAHEWGLDIF